MQALVIRWRTVLGIGCMKKALLGLEPQRAYHFLINCAISLLAMF